MRVSVVIPLFNKARHIERAVRSVLTQSHTDLELIVVDDGSTDGGREVVARISDSRLRVITQPNRGECEARNRGIREATQSLIAFLDADDEWFPRFLATVLALRVRHPEAGMFAAAYCLGYSGFLERPAFRSCPSEREGGLIEDYFASCLGTQPVTSSSVLIPRRVLEEVGQFPPGVQAGGDTHTWTRIAFRYRVAWTPVEGAVYHLAADNRVSASVPDASDVAVAGPIEAFLRTGEEPVSPRQSIVNSLNTRLLRMALGLCVHGSSRRARALLRKTNKLSGARRQRWILWLATWIPVPLLRLGLTVKAVIRLIRSHSDLEYEPPLSGSSVLSRSVIRTPSRPT